MGFRDYIGGHKRKIQDPGFFAPGSVGGMWGDYLKELYATPANQSPQFLNQSAALRDALAMESRGQKDEFTGASNAGGFFDSGARLSGLNDINRNRIASYSQGLSQILAKLESDKMQAAMPFLNAQIGGFSAYQDVLYKQDELQTQRKKQIAQTVGQIFGGAGAGGGGGGGGGYTAEAGG